MKRVVGAFCLLCLLSVDGTTLFAGCNNNSQALCLSRPVSYMCSGETAGDDILRWRVRNSTGDNIPNGSTTYAEGTDVSTPRTIATYFETILTSSAGPMESNISFSPVLAINGYTVLCDLLGTTPVSCPIMIADVPSAPVPNNPNFTSDTLTFSWSPSNSSCLSHYDVNVTSNVTSIEYTINTTDTSLSLPVPSPNGTNYSISVVAVDTGGRYMDPQGKRFVPDVPPAVTNLVLSQSYPDDDDDDDDVTVNITVSWNELLSPLRPNVLSYIVYHNVTDSDARSSITVSNSTTTHNIPDATVGSVYTVEVAAVNILGTGPTTSAIISITTSTSMTVSSSTMTLAPSSPSSSSSSTGATVTPSTSSAPTSTTASGTGNAMYIGIGAGVAVIVIGILIILIIVGCLIWRKPWKGEKANFDKRRDSTEPIALVHKKDPASPETGQPIYQEATTDIQREAAPTTGELYAQPNKGSVRRPPPQPELATYQDPSTIQRTQAPNVEYLYAEVDKSKPQQQQAVYAQVDKEKKGGDGTVYADLELKNTQGGPVTGSNPSNVIYSDVHNN